MLWLRRLRHVPWLGRVLKAWLGIWGGAWVSGGLVSMLIMGVAGGIVWVKL